MNMKIYEVKFNINMLSYIVAENINQVFRWLADNSKVEVISVEELGLCEKILKGDNNEN